MALGALAAFVVGTPAALAHGASDFWSDLPGIGTDFFTVISTVFGDLSLSVASFFVAIFVGWIWGVGKATRRDRNRAATSFTIRRLWSFLIRYVAPITIFIIFARVIWTLVAG